MKITCAMGPYLPVPPLMGGANEKGWLAMCEELAARGHTVTMISRRFANLPFSEVVNNVHHLRVPSRDAPGNILAYRMYDILYALNVRNSMPASDITITNSVSMPLILKRKIAGKIIVDVGRYPKKQMGLYRRVDQLRVGTRAIADAIKKQTPAMAERVMIIPNAISRSYAAEILQNPENRDKEILFTGRVCREKGVDILIKAFSQIHNKFPEWRLSIVGPWRKTEGGDGQTYFEELRAIVPPGAPVEFTGPIFDEEELRARYHKAAIFVYPSVAEKGETFGVAPVEAMACGCATIVSDLACFRDFLRQKENGLIFNHRDSSVESLAQSLELLINDSNLRIRIAMAAKITAANYNPSVIADQYVKNFHTLLDGYKRAPAQ